MKEEVKNRILMEMQGELTEECLRKLKMCLERNFYNLTLSEETTELVVANSYTNEKMIEKFEFSRGLEGVSRKTLEQYSRETKRFFDFIGKNYQSVTFEDIQHYLYLLIRNGNMTATSIDNSRKFLKPFFKWLYENEYIKKDVFIKIKPIKRIEKQKEFLSNKEIVNLRDSAKNDIRALALIDTLLSTGLRVSECSRAKISDVDFVKDEISIYATKTNSWRKVFLDANSKEHLLEYLSSRNDLCPYLFVNERKTNGQICKMCNCSIEKVLKIYAKKAEIKKDVNVHLFRKTMATRYKQMGMSIEEIAKILGHKSIKTTEQFYLSIMDNDIRHIVQKCS